MAYINKIFETDTEWYGPCPNKAGEFCGNNQRDSFRASEDGVVLEVSNHEMDGGPDRYPVSNFRVGKPSRTESYTSEQMESQGYVGFYLIADSTDYKGVFEQEVDTDILQEKVVTGEREPLHPFKPDVPMKSY